ncbi:2-phospho-L-lactate guanylyltransferase [Novosphingobium sp. PC22D]|nr:2-phospho-L-lactate guanylyltransferase [Novosphingobium sp. PC22D]
MSPAGPCWAVVPAKPASRAKSRLSGVLSPAERARLAADMLAHVVATARAYDAIDAVLVIGGSAPQGDGVEWAEDPGGGLNVALQWALDQVAHRGGGRVVTLAGDLPLLTQADLIRLIDLPRDTIGVAPDRHGTGTNALSLPLPGADRFRFAYGSGSFARHRSEARRIGYNACAILGNGLAKDIDEPDDLADAGWRES